VDVKRAAQVGDFDEPAVPFAFEVVAVFAALREWKNGFQ